MLSVIVDDSRDPARNLALDEALARAASTAGPDGQEVPLPVLRVWQNAPSVIVGRFQNIGESVDLAACARDGVRVVRRASGGGAVYTDSGSLNVTFVDSRTGPRPDLDVLLAATVEGFGLPADAIRGGVVQTAWLYSGRTSLAHATVHVTTVRPFGRAYVVPGAMAEQSTMADHGSNISLDAVRAAILGAVVDRYGIACARRPNPVERRWRDHLLTTRYGDITWHLTGDRLGPAGLARV